MQQHILIIEDNGPSAFLLASLCESVGRVVEIAYTMADAWKRIRGRFRYDLIFLDLALTDSSPQDSLDLIPELKRMARLVIVTGYAEDDTVIKHAKEADGFLSKNDPEFADQVMRQLEAAEQKP